MFKPASKIGLDWLGIAILVVSAAAMPQTALAASIDVGSATVAPGGMATLGVRLNSSGASIVATQNRIDVPPQVQIVARPDGQPDCAVSPAIDKTASGFRFLPLGCAGKACTAVRAYVLSFDNLDPIPDKSLLYTCQIAASVTAPEGDYTLRNSEAYGSDHAGVIIDVEAGAGVLRVRDARFSVDADSVQTAPGDDAEVSVRLHRHGVSPVGSQNRLDVAPPLRFGKTVSGSPDCVVNAAIDKPATAFSFSPADCVGDACSSVQVFVLAFDNTSAIPDGAVLYTCRLAVDPAASAGTYAVGNSEVQGADASGSLLPGQAGDGAVTVVSDGALVSMTVGEVRAIAGQRTVFDVVFGSLAPTPPAVAGTQNDIRFDAQIPIAASADGSPSCVVNPAINKEGTSFLYLPPQCVPGINCTGVRAFVLSLENTDPIPPNTRLYSCSVDVSSEATIGSYRLQNSNAAAGDPKGDPVSIRARDGQIDVICAGDCDGNGQVAIFELLRGVNILLGTETVDRCVVADSDENGEVSVSELVQAVGSALRGCRFDP